jgi:peptide/nickel transport system substrate-binding protein
MPLSARAAVLAGLLVAGPAAASDCGTVIVPTGIGLNDVPGTVATFHPVLFTGSIYELQLMNLLYRPLIWVGRGVTIDWSESLASAIDINADDTVFTVTLKSYEWSDGKPVTADDLLYDWSLIKQLGHAYVDDGIGGVPDMIASVREIDPLHVAFTLTHPVNPEWFELAGLSQFYPLPRHAWADIPLARQQSLQSEASFYNVVDGAFRLQSLDLGRQAVFVPNPAYSGHKASIRRLVVNFLQGSNPLEALEAGQLDMATLPFTLSKAADQLSGFQRISVGSALAFGVIIPNLRNPAVPFWDEVAIRQAIKRAIDQSRIISTVFHGHATPQAGLVPSSIPQLLAPDLHDGASPLGYDPAAARALLDGAGWKPGPDGIRVKDGHRLAFTVLVTADAETRLMLLQLVQADLARVGVALSIKEVEFNQLIARMLGPPADWEAVFLDYTVNSYPDPTQYFAPGASGNYEHYSDPTMDRLLAAWSGGKGREGLFAIEDYAVLQQPLIFLPDGSFTVLARPGIEGIDRFISPTGNWSPEYLTLHGELACDAPHA